MIGSNMNPDWDLLKATQESLREHMDMCKKKDVAYKKLQAHLETCQDAYDRDMAEADAEITMLRNDLTAVIGNNKGLIAMNAMLRQRHDLPVDRIPAYKRLTKEIADLKLGFLDVDYVFKRDDEIELLTQAIRNTLDTGKDRYISEVLEKIKEEQ